VLAYLAEQHDVGLHSRGVVLQHKRQMIGPREGESVAAYCRRAVQLQSDLANSNREVSQISMVEAVMDSLERERPEWTGVLQGMQRSLSGRESVLDIQPDLVWLEVGLKARSGHRAAAASADAATAVGAQSASILALEAKIEELSEQLGAIRGQAGAASQSGRTQGGARPQRRERRCYRCGGVDHLVSACPLPEQRGPFAGQGTLRCAPAAVCGSRWMVDSGCSDDMHPGGSLGERAFVNYRRFHQLLAVHLAKKGAHTQAVGVGQMELRGCTGAVVLSNVLHVPELDHPLFSVRQALARGWDVTFTHFNLFGSAEEVAVIHEGCSVLTGRGRRKLKLNCNVLQQIHGCCFVCV
jgi:hypothetical protein